MNFKNSVLNHPSRPRPDLLAVVLLPLTVLITRFSLSPAFGLYEDDYSRIPAAIAWDFHELIDALGSLFAPSVGHGLPLHIGFIYTHAFIGYEIAGMPGLYIIGLLLVSLNAILFYHLVKRISSPGLALFCALAFATYSADTTQAYLTHAFALQPSLTFFLLASHAYLSGRKMVAYLLALGILLTYETPFLLLLGIPLLKNTWDRKLIGSFSRNAAILLVMLFSAYAIRTSLGEGRAADLNLRELVSTSVIHMIQGPIVSLGTYLYRPIQTLQALDWTLVLVMLISFAAFALILSQLASRYYPAPPESLETESDPASTGRKTWMKLVRREAVRIFSDHRQMIIAAVVLLILAYPLTLTVRAYAISGRDSRVHFAGIIGASLLWGILLHTLMDIAARYHRRMFASIAIALSLSTLVGFGWIVQRDYARAWSLQQDFWSSALELMPDLSKGTVVLLEPEGLQDPRYIGANTWNLPLILQRIYTFPDHWEFYDIPRVYRLTPIWDDHILGEEGLFHLNARTTVAPRSYDRAVDPANVILLSIANGDLVRVEDAFMLNGREVQLKSGSPVRSTYPAKVLYPLLIE